MVLLIVGAIQLAMATSKKLRSGGAIVLAVLWVGLLQYGGWLFVQMQRTPDESPHKLATAALLGPDRDHMDWS